MFRIRPRGIKELQNQLSNGLEAVADEVMDRAVVPVLTGRTRESLHTDNTHSREWPKPATFVSTASGYGFFLHEGTSDTTAQPFLSQALDSVRSQIPAIIRSKT
jgi:hypothetical protein